MEGRRPLGKSSLPVSLTGMGAMTCGPVFPVRISLRRFFQVATPAK
jgi:hypothetical protein